MKLGVRRAWSQHQKRAAGDSHYKAAEFQHAFGRIHHQMLLSRIRVLSLSNVATPIHDNAAGRAGAAP